MVYSGAWGKLIHEKNKKSKISWHRPFKYIYHESTVRVKRKEECVLGSWTAGYAAAGDTEHAAAGHSGGCGELRQDQGRVPP